MARIPVEEWNKGDGLSRIESWARDGLTDAQIAANIGISYTTFKGWIRRNPPILAVLKKGKAPVDFEVENALLKRARGYEVTEGETVFKVAGTKTDENGKTVPILDYKGAKVIRRKRHIPPDTVALIFWLKNRKPDIWRDKPKESGADIGDGRNEDALSASLRELAEGMESDKP